MFILSLFNRPVAGQQLGFGCVAASGVVELSVEGDEALSFSTTQQVDRPSGAPPDSLSDQTVCQISASPLFAAMVLEGGATSLGEASTPYSLF